LPGFLSVLLLAGSRRFSTSKESDMDTYMVFVLFDRLWISFFLKDAQFVDVNEFKGPQYLVDGMINLAVRIAIIPE
jgi:hypothetical protein